MLTAIAHDGVCVPDVDAAVAWYRDVLGLTVLSPPYLMEGDAIRKDMGELVPNPVVKAAIVGLERGDRVVELLEYPASPGHPRDNPSITDHGISHIGLICDDIEETRRTLEARGVAFLTSGIADIAGLRTTWFRDPWGAVFILLEKADDTRPYWRQPFGG